MKSVNASGKFQNKRMPKAVSFRSGATIPILLLCAACGPWPESRARSDGPKPASNPPEQTRSAFVHVLPFSQPDPVSLPVGGTLTVEMLSGMETGYVARLSSISPSGALKAQSQYDTSNQSQSTSSQIAFDGADVDRVFVFRAVKPGTATIAWRARRGDYDHGPDDLTLQVTVTSATSQ